MSVFYMKTFKQRIWMLVGAAALLALTFALGYMLGSRSQKPSEDPENTLTATDMQRAFGSTKPTEPTSVHEAAKQEPQLMSLSGLLVGLEKKVAANPENIDQQLLLAQTYNELDNRAKSLNLLNSLLKRAPGNVQVKITLATTLMTGTERQELVHASKLFDDVMKLKPEAANMARLYQGEISVKLDNMVKQ